jgi:NTP pyrophosphatase (non-canonical NTP hydrolase)
MTETKDPMRFALPFQRRVQDWMIEAFSMEVCRDSQERNHRFLEEALELVQSCGCTASEAHQLVDYVYARDQGEINQEVGGVMVTLAAHCLAHDVDMNAAGETELARVWTNIDQIRANWTNLDPSWMERIGRR